eukprot:Rhum_TRINITY_DN11914_c0_g1::Rhum_TRINITY_DN11914_c0_g1_i1::g.47875::m.47875
MTAGEPPSPSDEYYSVLKDHGRGCADMAVVGYLEPLLRRVVAFVKDEGCEADWMYPTPVMIVKNMPMIEVGLFQMHLARHLKGVCGVEQVADGTSCLDRTDIAHDFPFCFVGETSRDFHCDQLLNLMRDLSLREQRRRHDAGDAFLPDCFSDVYGGAYSSSPAAPTRPRKALCVVAFHDSVMPTASLSRLEEARCRYNFRTVDVVQHCLTTEGLSNSVVCALLHPLSPVLPGYETLRDVPKVVRSRTSRCLRGALAASWEGVDVAAATEASAAVEELVYVADEGVALAAVRGAGVRSAGATMADFAEARAMVVYGFQSGLRVVVQKGTLQEKERAQKLVVDMWGSCCRNEGCADARYGELVEEFLRVVNVEARDVPLVYGVLQPDSVSAEAAAAHLRCLLTALNGCSKQVYKQYAKRLSMPALVQERAKLQVHPPGSTHTSPVEGVLWVMRKCTTAMPDHVVVQKVQAAMKQRGCTPLTKDDIEWAIQKLVEFDTLMRLKGGVLPKIKIVSTQEPKLKAEPSAAGSTAALAFTRSLSSADDAAAPASTAAALRPLKQVRGTQGATASMKRLTRWDPSRGSSNVETEVSGSQDTSGNTGSGSAEEGPFAPGETVFVRRLRGGETSYTECEFVSTNNTGSYNLKVKETGSYIKSKSESVLTVHEYQKVPGTEKNGVGAEHSTGTRCQPPKRPREESGPADDIPALRSPPAKKARRAEKVPASYELPQGGHMDSAQAASNAQPALDSDVLFACRAQLRADVPCDEGRELLEKVLCTTVQELMALRTSGSVRTVYELVPWDGDPTYKWRLVNCVLSALVSHSIPREALGLLHHTAQYSVLVHEGGCAKKSLETAGWVKPGDGTERSGFPLTQALKKAQAVCDAVHEVLFKDDDEGRREFDCFIGSPGLPAMKLDRKQLPDFLKCVKCESSYKKALKKKTFLRWFSTGADDDALASLVVELTRQELHKKLRAHTVSRGHYSVDFAFARAAGFECPEEESPNVVRAEEIRWLHGEGGLQADADDDMGYCSSQESSQGVTVSGSEDN